MKLVRTLAMVAVMLLTAAPAALAYEFDLTIWNVSQLQASGDVVHVNVSGKTITLTFTPGSPGISNTFQAMLDIGFMQSVFASNSLPVSGIPSGYSQSCGTTTGGGSCNEDGFTSNPAAAEYNTSGGPGGPTTVTFTFANNVVSGLTASDIHVHVQFSGGCSGWVDGGLKGSPTSDTSCTAGTAVPEPMTVFLGGTGLLAMGYFARKRLFAMGRSFAV